jgi:DNA-binding IclR family transcriptional regulator
LREQAVSFLRLLAEQTQLTVHIAVISQNDVVLIDKVEPRGHPERRIVGSTRRDVERVVAYR